MACSSPFTVRPKFNDNPKSMRVIDAFSTYSAPCGKCAHCRKSRVKQWQFRLAQEEKESKSSYFITLTYDNDNVPISPKGFMTLDNPQWYRKEDRNEIKRGKNKGNWRLRDDHLVQFFKLLRVHETRTKGYDPSAPKIKFYACAEYGETYFRPHYHIIAFNIQNPINISSAWKNKGLIDIQTDAKQGSFAYVAGYMNKAGIIPRHKNDDRRKEFTRSSQGLGASYVTPQIKKWHQQDFINRNYIQVGEHKQAMPRYYAQRIFTQEQRTMLADVLRDSKQFNEKKLAEDTNMSYFPAKQAQDEYLEILHKQKNSKKRDQWQNPQIKNHKK